MIYIKVIRNSNQLVESVTVTGHAEYDEPGKDIVCAGVSAVTFGAANAVEKLCGVALKVEQGESGFLRFILPMNVDSSMNEKIQLLIEGMLVSLKTIEISYSDFINIQTKIV
ncbi:ribosomal-processing cysteine protease Prp [Bacillus salitolerans]|uniref:Ribosomal processing cysteine protease Prp n=1 Tax=Bacillus salitolerans TaxID=1437434 RepID=A0ABW4LLQ6_9BACI